MPYSLDWFIPNQVIYCHYADAPTEEEIRLSIRTIIQMMDSSDSPYIHVITDTGDITKPLPPKKTLEISKEEGTHERTGWNLIIRERSALVKMGVAFGSILIKSQMRSFKTLEDAEAFLKSVDGLLNWDQVNSSVAERSR
ncbi:MAG: hypothetical protein KC615_22980 [Anaerolineae bacterium]|nr:hypothetical protein [Anaerolineae bacterium]